MQDVKRKEPRLPDALSRNAHLTVCACHCEDLSDEAISISDSDCFAALLSNKTPRLLPPGFPLPAEPGTDPGRTWDKSLENLGQAAWE